MTSKKKKIIVWGKQTLQVEEFHAKLAPVTDTIKLRFDPVNDKIYKLSKVK
jgi:hypothetical protein